MTTTLRQAFDDVLAVEPPLSIDPGRSAAAGRRLRRRRRIARGGALSAAAAVAIVVSVPLLTSEPTRSADELAVEPFAPLGGGTGGAPEAAPHAAPQAGLTAEQQRIAEAIRTASPAGWTFDLGADRWTMHPGVGGDHIEATADDGAGAGRLMIGISPRPGSQQLHPCRDDEFASTGTCTERLLPDGSVLSLRGVVDWEGIRTIYVVVTHPDGSGVGIESGNFTITWPLPRFAPPEVKRDIPRVTREDPTYTLDQLADVVLAVDRVVHG